MNTETINQAYLFLIFVLNGILIGIIFDLFRILRRSFKTPNIITYIEDTVFWIISASIVMYSLFVFNNGQFRAYIFIGIFLGVAIYMLLCSKIIIKISVKIITIFKKIFGILFKIISYPINLIYKVLNIILIKPISKIDIKVHNFLIKLKKTKKKEEILPNKEGF